MSSSDSDPHLCQKPMLMSDVNLIYVSAFMEVADRPALSSAELEGYVDQFAKLASTSIPIVLYICPVYYDIFGTRLAAYPNVECILADMPETWTHRTFQETTNLQLPTGRNPVKDSLGYITLQHSKIEWVANALLHRPTATHAAWVDFRLPHVFKSAEPLQDLKRYTKRSFSADTLYMPGCHPPRQTIPYHSPHWRFCGGFFLGSRDRLMDFWNLTLQHLSTWLAAESTASWEVNFWAWLEANHSWTPTWYAADHNDSIVQIKEPPTILTTHPKAHPKQPLQCPPLENAQLHPMNTSYVRHRGLHILNTRYINYRMSPAGTYDTSVLHTSNVCTILDASYNAFLSHPLSNSLDIPSHPTHIHGLEDIRLFSHDNKLYALGTQREWSPCGRNRMVLGLYDAAGAKIHSALLLQPPIDTACEKNWIPTKKPDSTAIHFIYKWHPYSVGTVNTEGKLQLHTIEDYGTALQGLKGSAVPVSWGGSLWTLVHRSEGLKYTHCFVLLDPATLLPQAKTQEFIFESVGVEYCIGFTVEGNDACTSALFWYSVQDSNPTCLRIPMSVFRTEPINQN